MEVFDAVSSGQADAITQQNIILAANILDIYMTSVPYGLQLKNFTHGIIMVVATIYIQN